MQSGNRTFWLRLLGLALLLVAAPARAQSAPGAGLKRGVHLSWVRSAGAVECGDAGSVQADVTRRLGESPFSEPSRVFVEAVVSREGASYQAQLELLDERGGSLGSRKVTSDAPSCASLVSAAGLAIALMIDPDAVVAPKAKPAPPVPIASPAPPRQLVCPAPQPRPERTSLTASLVAAARSLPEASLGMRLGGELRLWRRLDAALSLTFLPEARLELHGFDVGFGLTYASGGGCYRLVDATSVQLSGCGFASVGAMRAVTYAPDRSRQSQLVWSAAGVGLGAAWLVAPPLVLQGGVEGSVPLRRRDYLVRRGSTDEVVFSDPALSATLHVGLGVRF